LIALASPAGFFPSGAFHGHDRHPAAAGRARLFADDRWCRWAKTRAALIAFQRSAGLYPDGVLGPKTIAALKLPAVVDVPPAPARQSTSAIGLAALIGREARKLRAYLDSVGIWSIGIGHTAAAGAPIPYRGLTITLAECDAIFARDIVQYEVRRAVPIPSSIRCHRYASTSAAAGWQARASSSSSIPAPVPP
jgi:hypothetical protein